MRTITLGLAAFALTMTAAGVAHADGVVVDYTDKKFRTAEPAVAPADKTRLSTSVAALPNPSVKALGQNFVVLGAAKGGLDKAGPVDFFLLSAKPPVAAEPFPQGPAQVVVAMKGNEVAGTWTLPAGRQYSRLVGAVDIDGDKSSEVLLQGSGFNMGQLVMSLEAVKLASNDTTSVVQKIPEVYVDACENPTGPKDRSAKTISLKNRKLEATSKAEKCG
jgi:hypothetical protein